MAINPKLKSTDLNAQRDLDAAVRRVEASTVRQGERNAQDRTMADRIAALAHSTNVVCAEVLGRRNGDESSLAFALIANYSLGHLGTSVLARRTDVYFAMLWNLRRLQSELETANPQGLAGLDAWRESLQALQEPTRPVPLDEPHPLVYTLAPLVRQIRNAGLRLSGFGEFYAPGERGIHVINPA